MGMFDYVVFEVPCPNCGKTVKGFQSKDGDCLMETVKPWTVSNFYTSCTCGTWIEYRRKPAKTREDWLDDYDLITERPDI